MKKFYLTTLLFLCSFVFVSLKSSAFTLDTVSTVHPSCDMAQDGSITVSVTGAVGTVSYSVDGSASQVSPILTGLTEGQHWIYAEDETGTIESLLVSLPPGPGLEMILTTTATVCYGAPGGTLTITPVNEVAPFTISNLWGGYILDSTFTVNDLSSVVLTNLPADFYSMNVTDARGCVNTISSGIAATVPSGDSLNPSTSIIAPSCLGSGNGYVSFQFNVGDGPYDFFDANLLTSFASQILSGEPVGPLNAGTYTLIVEDNIVGCWGQIELVIPEGSDAATQVSSSASSICGTGGTVSLTGSDGGSLQGIQYNWSPATGLSNATIANPVASPAVSTTYTLTTTDATSLCTSSATITIDVTNVETPLVSLSSAVLSVTNPQTSASYTWQQLNGSIWDDVGTGTSYNSTTGNQYRVRSVIGGCDAYSISTTARSSSPYPYAISMYPNPTTDYLRLGDLKVADQWQTLEIISYRGQIVVPVKQIRNQTSVAVSIASLGSGIYIAKLTKSDGSTVELRFIKQ